MVPEDPTDPDYDDEFVYKIPLSEILDQTLFGASNYPPLSEEVEKFWNEKLLAGIAKRFLGLKRQVVGESVLQKLRKDVNLCLLGERVLGMIEGKLIIGPSCRGIEESLCSPTDTRNTITAIPTSASSLSSLSSYADPVSLNPFSVASSSGSGSGSGCGSTLQTLVTGNTTESSSGTMTDCPSFFLSNPITSTESLPSSSHVILPLVIQVRYFMIIICVCYFL